MEMCRWLDPVLVARIEFLEWTPEHRLRHPRFAGIRSDKDAGEVVREGVLKPITLAAGQSQISSKYLLHAFAQSPSNGLA